MSRNCHLIYVGLVPRCVLRVEVVIGLEGWLEYLLIIIDVFLDGGHLARSGPLEAASSVLTSV